MIVVDSPIFFPSWRSLLLTKKAGEAQEAA